MKRIDDIKFGSITIDGKKYTQVLIIDGKVEQRDEKALRKEFGTTHHLSKYEQKQLLSNNPKIILIGTGMSGALKLFPEFIENIKSKKIKLIQERSKKAVKLYGSLSKTQRINALIHTTC